VTFVARLQVDQGAIREGTTTVVGGARVASGAADVDGDGTRELVLIGQPSIDDTDCLGRILFVFDGASLSTRRADDLGPIDVEGAAIGRLGPGHGQVLVAQIRQSCAFNSPGPDAVVAIDLLDGSTRAVLPLNHADSAPIGPLIPLIVDRNGDGIDEAIVRDGQIVYSFDPANNGQATIESNTGQIPFAVVDPRRSPRLLLDLPGLGGSSSQIGLMELPPTRPGDPQAGPIVSIGTRTRAASGLANPGLEMATDPAAAPPVWSGDLVGDGCTEVIVPEAIFQRCPDAATGWTVKSGPAWLQTTPLLAYGDTGSRRLLVAAGVGWQTDRFGLAVPAPSLSGIGEPGAWRAGPSSPFVLQVLDATDIGYFELYPTPAVDIDPNLTDDRPAKMILGGAGGDRIFVRLTPGAEGPAGGTPTPGTVPADPGNADDYLRSPPRLDLLRIATIPVSDASTAGANPGAAFVTIPDGDGQGPGTTDGPPPTAGAWDVEAMSLNAYGEPSAIAIGHVAIDRTGPNVVVDPPFLSATWPFSAPIRGVAEPNARVRLGDGPYVKAALNGAFELRSQLAPWPQDLTIQAVDQRGNTTNVTISVVGGIDYRRLPWQAVLITAILLGAAITTWGGPSFLRRRTPGAAAGGPRQIGRQRSLDGRPTARSRQRGWPDAGVEATAEIEDLPPSRPDRTG